MDAYCATGDAGGRKLIYGKGTRLHVESSKLNINLHTFCYIYFNTCYS